MSAKIVDNCIDMKLFVSEIKKYLKDESKNLLIFDIGSKDGKDAKFIGNNFKNTTVYAFEAHPVEYSLHKDSNRDINWVELAIYNYDGQTNFHPKEIDSGIHSIRDRGQIYGKDIINVECRKISTFLQDRKLPCPDIVKIDVEGCTLEVLQSFEDCIENVRFFHIESETQDYFKGQHLEEEVFDFLRNKGFTMIMYSIPENLNQHDSIWIKP